MTLGEDAGQAGVRHTPQVPATLRIAVLRLPRAPGWGDVAAAARHAAAERASRPIGVPPG